MNEDIDKFNLVAEKWIPCRMTNETSIKLEYFSIEEALLRAHEIREIAAESPPVTISLYRLLLAVLHRCLGPLSFHGEWQEVWQQGKGRFDPDKINEYLRNREYGTEKIDISSRFCLFDEQYPFYQSTNTIGAEPGKHLAQKLLFHDDDSATLFLHLTNADPAKLTLAQAARWLIAFQCFDVGGLKSRTAADKSPSAEVAPLLKAAVGLARGKNLFQTLLLNLYWDDRAFFTGGKDQKDKPAWERDKPIVAEARRVDGYLDLLTWQSRRIRLFADESRSFVKQAVIMAGYKFPDGFERNDSETMIAFRKATSAKAKAGFEPVSFVSGRALWRDSHALFHHVKDGGQRRHSLLVLDWLDKLEYVGAISDRSGIPIDFFGMIYNPQKVAQLLFWRHERLPLPLAYLSNDELCRELKRALSLAELSGKLLKDTIHRFAVLLFIPDNHLKEKYQRWFMPFQKRDEAIKAEKEQFKFEKETKRAKDIDAFRKAASFETHYWPRLENEFRTVMVRLARDLNDWWQQRERWAKAVRRAAEQTMQEIIGGAGDSTRTLRAAAIASSWFEAEFNRCQKNYLNNQTLADAEETEDQNEEEERSEDE